LVISKLDSLYKEGRDFQNFNIKSQKFLTYAGGKSSYYYATGYNLLLVLDKLDIEYKDKIFKNIKKPVFEYLEEYVQR